MRNATREKLALLSPEVRVIRMQGLLRTMVKTEFMYTPAMAAFRNLYDVHSPTVPVTEHDSFLGQLDQPEGIFTEETWNGIVWRYDDLRCGKDPSEAASVIFDRPEDHSPAQ